MNSNKSFIPLLYLPIRLILVALMKGSIVYSLKINNDPGIKRYRQ